MRKIEDFYDELRYFSKARNWEQYHSPKNLTMALSVEVSELVEHFQWLKEEESYSLKGKDLEDVCDEIADIQIYLMLIADKLNINIANAVDSKIKKNNKKYPIDKRS